MGSLIKLAFYFIIILLIFAVLPKSVLEKIKNFFNWNVFLNTLKVGFQNFLNFLKEIGLDFNQINEKIKTVLGIDLKAFFIKIKNLLANFLFNLANSLK